jgi:hypothetical protein
VPMVYLQHFQARMGSASQVASVSNMLTMLCQGWFQKKCAGPSETDEPGPTLSGMQRVR